MSRSCESCRSAPVRGEGGEPAGVVELVVTLRVEEPEPVTEVGLKVPVAPVGNPVTLRVTTPVKPFRAPTVAV